MSVGRAFNSERESASRKRWREIDKIKRRPARSHYVIKKSL